MKRPDASLNNELIDFLGTTIPERAQIAKELLLVLQVFGLKDVYSTLNDDDLNPISRMRNCQTLDLLLTTGLKWLKNKNFVEAAKNLARRGATVRILLSRERMDEKTHLYKEYTKLINEISVGEHLQIRLYDEKPVFRAIITNGTELILSHYHYKDEEKADHGWRTPQLRFEQAGEYSLTGPFNQLFKRIWESGKSLSDNTKSLQRHQDRDVVTSSNNITTDRQKKDFFIITSNENENRAVLDELRAVAVGRTLTPNVEFTRSLSTVSATVNTQHGEAHIEVAVAHETGGAIAADLLRRRTQHDQFPTAVFVIGCAGLLMEKYASASESASPLPKGLVFLAKKASDGDARLVEDTGTTLRGDSYHGHPRLIEGLRILNGLKTFETDGITLVTNREFISTAAFIASKDSEERKRLVDQFISDAVVVENEAYAIYQMVQSLQSEAGRVLPCLVVKGISDLGDEDARFNNDKKQFEASSNAAKVVLRLVLEQ